MVQIEQLNHLRLKLFNCMQIELLLLESDTWNHLTVYKKNCLCLIEILEHI